MNDPKDHMLDDLFTEARTVTPPVSDDLMARVLADATRAEEMGVQTAPGLWARLYDIIGGWPALGGLATAAIAGLWLGITPPAALDDLTAQLTGDTVNVTLLADMSWSSFESETDG